VPDAADQLLTAVVSAQPADSAAAQPGISSLGMTVPTAAPQPQYAGDSLTIFGSVPFDAAVQPHAQTAADVDLAGFAGGFNTRLQLDAGQLVPQANADASGSVASFGSMIGSPMALRMDPISLGSFGSFGSSAVSSPGAPGGAMQPGGMGGSLSGFVSLATYQEQMQSVAKLHGQVGQLAVQLREAHADAEGAQQLLQQERQVRDCVWCTAMWWALLAP
jgi:hypothetical protein